MTRFALFPALFVALLATDATAKTCEVEIAGNDAIQFDREKITVDAGCDSVTLTLNHTGKLDVEQMGHNWTLARKEDWRDLAMAGQSAGRENDYLPADDDRVLAHTDLVGGGESTSITFDLAGLSAEEDYVFFCSFPGHWAQMNGAFIIR